MAIASDSFRTVTVKIHDISQWLPYIIVNQADDNGKIIRFVPMDQGQKVTGFTGARLYYPPRSGDPYGDYVTGVESDGAWDFTIPVGALSVGRVECNLAFIDGDGETYSRNVEFLVEPAVSGVFDPEDGQQTRIDKIIGTVQTAADSAIENINNTATDAVESIGEAEEFISNSVTEARGSADAAAESAKQAAASVSAVQTSERNAASSATAAAQSATAAQNAVDGFGLEVGTTTTGEPGTDAVVEIQKAGTKYTANFTIPRGDKGDQALVAHDGTLTGDGTASKPLGAAMGSAVNQTYVFADGAFDLNNLTDFGIFALNNDQHTIANIPVTPFRGCVFVTNNGYPPSNKSSISQVALCRSWSGDAEIYTRTLVSGTWHAWKRMAFASDIPNVSALTSRITTLQAGLDELAVMQTRVEALEARVKSLETN